MTCVITVGKLIELINKQLNSFFFEEDRHLINNNIDEALYRLKVCLSKCKNKYFYADEGTEVTFSPYNTIQYTIFLYYIANTIYKKCLDKRVKSVLPDQIYYLNKIMNGVDWYYEIELPDYFSAEHPIGSVLGRAVYSNGLFIYQGVTIGGNKKMYPVINENVLLYSNATLLGNSHIGKNVVISSGTTIIDNDIPDNSIVFGRTPDLVIKTKDINYMNEMMEHIWKLNY